MTLETWHIMRCGIFAFLLSFSWIAVLIMPCMAISKGDASNLGIYEVIVKKNLFDPLRGEGAQDETDEKARYASEQDLVKRYQVYGVSITNGRQQAFIKGTNGPQPNQPVFPTVGPQSPKPNQDTQTERPHPVMIGDSIEGWRIVAITSQGIDLELQGRRVHLAIFGPEKDERRATAPVGLQTPQIKPETTQPQTGGEQLKEGESAAGQTQPPQNAQTPSVSQTIPPPQAAQSIHPFIPQAMPSVQPPPSVPPARRGSSLRDLMLGNH
ncbi:MAG: hypothetical protein ACUVQV_06355 [Dissulfurimicrobium sp.]|uniref:hypothetical protein n=1 Tax=Dissulfurimicrobium sp. TaxID=2022436 RepID=UPI00404A3C09